MRKFISCIFILVSTLAFSQERDVYTIATLYNSIGLRPANFMYLAEGSIEELKANGLEQRDQGLSINYETPGKGNFSVGLKYYRTIFTYFPILYAGIQPCYYKSDNQNGFNIRPELGFLYDIIWQHLVGLRLKLAYGYDVPLANREGFSYSRSIIDFKIGITFNLKHKTSY